MVSKPVIAVGIGAGLVGSFLLLREAQKWLVRHKLDKLRAQAVAGQIPARQFLDAVLASGSPAAPGAPKITVEDAKRLQCSAVFPDNVFRNLIPQFDAAIDQMRRDGTCL